MSDCERIQSILIDAPIRHPSIVGMADDLLEFILPNRSINLNFDNTTLKNSCGDVICQVIDGDELATEPLTIDVEGVNFSLFRGLLAHIAVRSKTTDGRPASVFRHEGRLAANIAGEEHEFSVRIENMAGQFSLNLATTVQPATNTIATANGATRYEEPVTAVN